MLIPILLVVGTFLFMVIVSMFTNKFFIHGFLWVWNEDHHADHKNFFEKNDLFSVCFSIIAMSLIFTGTLFPAYRNLLWLGIGVTCYGIFYFVFHDIIVHRRIKIKFVAKSSYMKRIMMAHYVHHKVHQKEGAEAFGFLYAPKKYDKIK